MPLIETALAILSPVASVLSPVASAAGLHSWVGGLHTGRRVEQMAAQLQGLDLRFEKLAERITYASSLKEAHVREPGRHAPTDLREVAQLLTPLQRGLKDDILSTAIVSTPDLLRHHLREDPWNVFVDIRPLSRANRPNNPALVPVVFEEAGAFYVGWQTRGMLGSVLAVDYSPATAESRVSSPGVDSSLRSGRPSWAAEAGRDQFGEWVRVDVRNVSFRMRRIPAGTFWMGSPEDEEGRFEWEGPRHQVTLSQDFWLGETPVTQALWQAVMGNSPSKLKGTERPVEQVSWDDVQEFLQSVSGQAPGLHLPTEAQWEYACRAGSQASRYGDLDAVAWWSDNSRRQTHLVGEKQPNAWGLHDMLGNVWEWCHDYYGSYGGAAVIDPIGPNEGTYRVLRGGSWYDHAQGVRAAYRRGAAPSRRVPSIGFRLSRDHSAPSK